MQLAGVKPGMSVADVGAGEGYYTVRLAPRRRREGPRAGRRYRPRGPRQSERPGPAREPRQCRGQARRRPTTRCFRAQSFDRVFLVHMYHEVQSPYAFLWHLRDGLKPDGLVVVVDADRPVKRHGIPPAPAQMRVRRARHAAGEVQRLAGGDAYFMAFRLAAPAAGARADQALRRAKAARAAAGCVQSSPREHQMVEHRAVERLGRAASRRVARQSDIARARDRRSDGCGRGRFRRCHARRHRQ